jgi:hypothetical protein
MTTNTIPATRKNAAPAPREAGAPAGTPANRYTVLLEATSPFAFTAAWAAAIRATGTR